VSAASRLPRRFYTLAGVGEAEGGFAVLLDGRPLRTPRKAALVVGSRTLAEALAAEWAAQVEVVDPASMPLTRLVNVAIDGVTGETAAVRADIVGYAGSDLICYRAEGPEGLVAAQARAWDPVVTWAREVLGAHLRRTEGVMFVRQSDAALAAVRAAIAHLDPLALTAVHVATTLTGSAMLALALLHGRLRVDEAWAAAHVDEDWNIAQWGADAEAMQRRAKRFEDLRAAALVLDALNPRRAAGNRAPGSTFG
jgi:chaperone required for assembly of F1-ATPase